MDGSCVLWIHLPNRCGDLHGGGASGWVRVRARGFAAGMLSPMGTVFALFLVFTAAQVWTDRDRATAAVDQEASWLRAAVILAGAFPGDSQTQLESLIRSHIEEAATNEWPMMAAL